MGRQRVGLAGLIPAAFQTMTLSDSTAISVDSTVRTAGAQVLDISVETNNVRYRADGTDPTLNTGVVLQKDTLYRFSGYNGTSNMAFQRTTGSATVSIMAYKHD